MRRDGVFAEALPITIDEPSLRPRPRRLVSAEPVVARGSDPLVRVAGRSFRTSPVFDTYWRFAAARQAVYRARLAGASGPWTADPILKNHRFTNCYRAADRVSQFGISEVAYQGSQEPENIVFRLLLFKMFNKIETWQLLVEHLGEPRPDVFDFEGADKILTDAIEHGRRLYSAAYVVPPPRLGGHRKHTNHLRLLAHMMGDRLPQRLLEANSMEAAFHILKSYPAMGGFLAFQFLIDINYSSAVDFDEMDFVVAGPGAKDGIRKCFGPDSRGYETELIRYMTDTQEENFERLGLKFDGLFGRRLQLIDCQNLFCEVDKYSRVAHPEFSGHSGRTRIKQKFAATSAPVTAWFPPKWGINDRVAELAPPGGAPVQSDLLTEEE